MRDLRRMRTSERKRGDFLRLLLLMPLFSFVLGWRGYGEEERWSYIPGQIQIVGGMSLESLRSTSLFQELAARLQENWGREGWRILQEGGWGLEKVHDLYGGIELSELQPEKKEGSFPAILVLEYIEPLELESVESCLSRMGGEGGETLRDHRIYSGKNPTDPAWVILDEKRIAVGDPRLLRQAVTRAGSIIDREDLTPYLGLDTPLWIVGILEEGGLKPWKDIPPSLLDLALFVLTAKVGEGIEFNLKGEFRSDPSLTGMEKMIAEGFLPILEAQGVSVTGKKENRVLEYRGSLRLDQEIEPLLSEGIKVYTQKTAKPEKEPATPSAEKEEKTPEKTSKKGEKKEKTDKEESKKIPSSLEELDLNSLTLFDVLGIYSFVYTAGGRDPLTFRAITPTATAKEGEGKVPGAGKGAQPAVKRPPLEEMRHFFFEKLLEIETLMVARQYPAVLEICEKVESLILKEWGGKPDDLSLRALYDEITIAYARTAKRLQLAKEIYEEFKGFQIKVSGIRWKPTGAIAVINDRIYGVGEVLADLPGKAVVKIEEITEYHVVFLYKGQRFRQEVGEKIKPSSEEKAKKSKVEKKK